MDDDTELELHDSTELEAPEPPRCDLCGAEIGSDGYVTADCCLCPLHAYLARGEDHG